MRINPPDSVEAERDPGRKVGVLAYKAKNLRWAATYYKNIPRDLPAQCQLPESIPVGTHGHFLHRPDAWR